MLPWRWRRPTLATQGAATKRQPMGSLGWHHKEANEIRDNLVMRLSSRHLRLRPRIPEQWGKSPATPAFFAPKPRVPFQKRPTNRPVCLVYKLPDPLLFQPLLSMYRDVFLLDEILSFGAKVSKRTWWQALLCASKLLANAAGAWIITQAHFQRHHQISCFCLDIGLFDLLKNSPRRLLSNHWSALQAPVSGPRSAPQVLPPAPPDLHLHIDKGPQHDCRIIQCLISFDSHMKKHRLAWDFTWHS